jgi:hypothetical protein
MKTFLNKGLFLLVIITCLSFSFIGSLSGQILTVNGTYTGNINGEAVNGVSSGTIDVSGLDPSMNDITINFSDFPISCHPYAQGICWITIVCGNGIAATAPAQNLFELSGGNYSMNRSFTWPSFPGDEVIATGTASFSGTEITYTMNLTGTYSGPTNLIGVASHDVEWGVIENFGVQEEGLAEVLTPTGSFTTNIVTEFLFPATISQLQQGSYQINELSFEDNTYHSSWGGIMHKKEPEAIPTLTEWGIIILILLLLAVGMVFIYKRQTALAMAGGVEETGGRRFLLFNKQLYAKVFGFTLIAGLAFLGLTYLIAGEITSADPFGTFVSAGIIAYMIHLLILHRSH